QPIETRIIMCVYPAVLLNNWQKPNPMALFGQINLIILPTESPILKPLLKKFGNKLTAKSMALLLLLDRAGPLPARLLDSKRKIMTLRLRLPIHSARLSILFIQPENSSLKVIPLPKA